MARAAAKSKRPDGSRMVHVRLDPEQRRCLRILVAAEDTSVQDWLARAVKKAVSQESPNGAKEGE